MTDGTLLRNLHKVARCLHDGLCPKCGSTSVINLCCQDCGLYISPEQDDFIRLSIITDDEVLGKAVAAFEDWQKHIGRIT